MADQKISELTALTGANLADVDAFAVVDTSAVQTKKITYAELKTALDTGTGFVRITGDAMTGALGITQTGSPSTIPLSVHSNLNSGLPILELRSTANSNSTIDLRADGTGDPRIWFDLNGATAFAMGVDNSDGNKFKISGHSQLGTNPRLTIDSSGNSTFAGTVAGGKVAITGGTATSEASHATFTNTQGAKTYAVGAGQSGVTNNGFVIRNVTDNSFPLVISDAGAATFGGTVTANAGVVVDNITIDGNEIDVSSGNLMLDVAGYIELSSDDVGGSVYFSDGGTTYGRIYNSSSNLRIKSQIGDKSISFEGVDGSNPITALTLDMSNAGAANFVGNVGIGVIPARKLHIYNTAALDVALLESTQVFSTLAFKSSSNASTVTVGIDGAGNASFTNKLSSGHIKFATASTDRVTIDNSGRVGINSVPNTSWRNDASDTVLQLGTEATLHSDANVTTELWNNAYVNNSDQYKNISTRGSSRYMQYEGNHRFFTAASASAGSTISMGERARLDVSGNLMVGKTALNDAVVGAELRASGIVVGSAASNVGAVFNRNTSDGSIVSLKKGGAEVGSIGTDGGSLVIGGGDVGLGFYQSADALVPYNGVTGLRDSAIDLGMASSGRFKDLYLSGTANSSLVSVSTSSGKMAEFNSTHANHGYIVLKEDGTEKFYMGASTAVSGQTVGFTFYTASGDGIDFNTGGSNTPKLRITSDGKIGIGSTAPVTQLDVVSSGNARMLIHTDLDGGLAHLMFKTDSQNLDSRMKGAIIFKRDDPGTRGTGSLHLCVNGVNSDVNAGIADSKLSIDSSGNLLVGSTSNVLGSRAFIESTGSTHVIGARVGANGHYALGAINAAGTVVGGVVVNASSTTYATSSDYRLKENVDYTWDATTRLKQLKPARFNFIADDTNTLVDGFLAHEVSSVVPEAITGTKDAVDADGNPEYQGIDHSVLVPLLVKTIQELEARITALEA